MVAGSVISRSRRIFTLKYPPGEEDLRFRRWMNSASGYLWREPSFLRPLPKGWEFPRVPNHLCFEGNFYQFIWPATSSHLGQSIQHYLHLSSRMQKDLRFRRDSFLPTFFFNKLILLHVRDSIKKLLLFFIMMLNQNERLSPRSFGEWTNPSEHHTDTFMDEPLIDMEPKLPSPTNKAGNKKFPTRPSHTK